MFLAHLLLIRPYHLFLQLLIYGMLTSELCHRVLSTKLASRCRHLLNPSTFAEFRNLRLTLARLGPLSLADVPTMSRPVIIP